MKQEVELVSRVRNLRVEFQPVEHNFKFKLLIKIVKTHVNLNDCNIEVECQTAITWMKNVVYDLEKLASGKTAVGTAIKINLRVNQYLSKQP